VGLPGATPHPALPSPATTFPGRGRKPAPKAQSPQGRRPRRGRRASCGSRWSRFLLAGCRRHENVAVLRLNVQLDKLGHSARAPPAPEKQSLASPAVDGRGRRRGLPAAGRRGAVGPPCPRTQPRRHFVRLGTADAVSAKGAANRRIRSSACGVFVLAFGLTFRGALPGCRAVRRVVLRAASRRVSKSEDVVISGGRAGTIYGPRRRASSRSARAGRRPSTPIRTR